MPERDELWRGALSAAVRAARPGPSAGRERRIQAALEAARRPERPRPSLRAPWSAALAFACLGLLLWTALPRPRPAPVGRPPAETAADPAWEGLGAGADLGPCSLASDCG